MPPLETLLVFTIAAFIMNLSPGPSNLYVMSRSVAQGSAAGAIAGCGLAVGSLAHVAAAAFGLSAVFVYSPLAYTVLKLLARATSYTSGSTICSISLKRPWRRAALPNGLILRS